MKHAEFSGRGKIRSTHFSHTCTTISQCANTQNEEKNDATKRCSIEINIIRWQFIRRLNLTNTSEDKLFSIVYILPIATCTTLIKIVLVLFCVRIEQLCVGDQLMTSKSARNKHRTESEATFRSKHDMNVSRDVNTKIAPTKTRNKIIFTWIQTFHTVILKTVLKPIERLEI